jgi:PAS domain S-box-containing protein
VSHGRSLFYFAIPIILASVLLRSYASFGLAALTSYVIIRLSLSIHTTPDPTPIIGFFGVALISWLSSRSLEEALSEVRTTNANLDKLVTERTQALAEALARQRAEAGQRQAILNSIADGVIVFDTAGNSILFNPAVQNLLDTPLAWFSNKTFSDLAQSPNLSARDRSLLQTMMETRTQPSSFRIQWGKKTLSVSAAPVSDTANEEIGTVAVFRDVTREAELERMKSSFIAMVSHELRTPLNAIMGFAEMLREAVYGPVNEKQTEASNRILMNTRHMLGMVGDLLDQAQMEAGKLRITAELFQPAELLKNIQEVMGQIVNEKGLTLTSEVDPRLPESLMGDPHRLQQILMNLVNNGIKFTESGYIRVRLFLAGPKHWGLEVRDSGRGIPQEELDHIFEAFHQVDTSTTRQQGGFGLGLSIVKQLVQLMKGEVNVQSILGRGSTFTVTLPLTEEDLERKHAMSHSALIVEDDADLAAIFAEALKSAGFEAQVIRDGAIAQQRIKEVAPHIIVLDLHLPNVDGSILLNQIRTDSVLKGSIVIVATADALMGEIYRDVADIVLIKPVSYTQLRDLSVRLRAVQWDGREATGTKAK